MMPSENPSTERAGSSALPIRTLAGFLVVLVLFAVLSIVNPFGSSERGSSDEPSPREKLDELQAKDRIELGTSSDDKASGTRRIRLEDAINKMIDEGNKNGKLPFPAPPRISKGSSGKKEQ